MKNRREFLQLLLAGAGASLFVPQINFAQTDSANAWKTEYPKILARIKAPKFRKKDYLVTKYGAIADGKTLATEAFRKAIEACKQSGRRARCGSGGRVFDRRDSSEIKRQSARLERRDREIFD